ncbi:MAG: hypothetical protein RL095_503 [Verrucomicrobiota bacterium]|jgi:TPR repeat protein
MKYLKTIYSCSLLSLTSCEALLLPGYIAGETVKASASVIDAGFPLAMADAPFVYTIDGYKISIDVPKYARTIDPNYVTIGAPFVSLGKREWAANGVFSGENGRAAIGINYFMESESSIHYYKFRSYKFNEPMPKFEKVGNYNVLVSPENNWLEVEINKRLILKIFGGGPKYHDPIMEMKKVIQNMKIEEIPGVAHQTLLPLSPDPRSLAIDDCRKKAITGTPEDYLNLYYALLKSPDYFEQDEALSWLVKSANNNQPKAQWELSLYHYTNILRSEKSHEKSIQESRLAFQWLERSANNNCAEAQYALGSMLWRGYFSLPPKAKHPISYAPKVDMQIEIQPGLPINVSKNDKIAATWLEKSAASGNHNAITALMNFYAYSATLRNRDSVSKWQAQALAAGLYDEVFEFLCLWGFSLGAGKDGYVVDSDAALKCLNEAEFIRKNHKIKPVQKQHYKDGIYDTNPVSTIMIKIGLELGPRYDWANRETFWFAAKNFDQAMFWFQKSGEIGGPEYWKESASKFIQYPKTNTVADNQRKFLAEHFGTKAAEAGNAEACYRLSNEYSKQKKYDLAMKWLLIGADYELKKPSPEGWDSCIKSLASEYENGIITKKNLAKAKYWWEIYLKTYPKGASAWDARNALKRLN